MSLKDGLTPESRGLDRDGVSLPLLTSRSAAAGYWRSLDELADTPEFRRFIENEFPSLLPELQTPASRRTFLKLMGASLALAGLAACRWPRETILPASRQPVNRIPGETVQFATGFELAGAALGLLVTSYDGRPLKIEGNPQHPFSRGKTDLIAQATILDLYDPDRLAQPGRRASGAARGTFENVAWPDFDAYTAAHFAALRERGGAGLVVLTEHSSSPTLADLRARFGTVLPQAVWIEFETLSRDHPRAGLGAAFGRPTRAQLDLSAADVIVSLDDDFLMSPGTGVRLAGEFAARRRAADGTMNRLYVVESSLTVTGAAADHRLPLRSSDVGVFAALLARALLALGVDWPTHAADLRPALESVDAAGPDPHFVRLVAADLNRHRGRSLLTVGVRQPPAVHLLAAVLNEALGNVGATVTYTDDLSPAGRIEDVLAAGRAELDTLLILGGNPVWHLPAELDLPGLIARTKTSLYFGTHADETAALCSGRAPLAHYLESWGDARAYDGTVTLVQPLIEPLFGGRTVSEVVARLLGDDVTSAYDLVRRTFRAAAGAGPEWEAAWRQSLHDGLVAGSAWPREPRRIVPPADTRRADELRALLAQRPAREGTFELVFVPDYKLYDGRFANNGWLQELPDPITKLTWDNAALVSPADAAKLGIRTYGDVLRIELAGRSVQIPAYILPGQAEGSVTLPLGYGRGALGGVVAADAGTDVRPLRTAAAPHVALGARISGTGQHRVLATTQDHHAIASAIGDAETQRRAAHLIREGTLAEYRARPDFAAHAVHLPPAAPLWTEKEWRGHRWGMAIDLTACIGCSACVVACQAENNIPVVGKDEVARGREMHWIRIDRYFKNTRAAAAHHATGHDGAGAPAPLEPVIRVAFQPMTCHHCETAPCESVCPVAATVHDEEGLNVMVYNRCVGTRYCSNNCPYKVRRFNWFWNHHGPAHPRSRRGRTRPPPGRLRQELLADIEKLQHNPDVSVRSRGVMEKCTFCTQRINAVKIRARNVGRAPADGEIVPACAQVCPTEAIVFGDLADPDSRVSRLHAEPRAYIILGELNTQPRTQYLAKLWNPAESDV